jgi:hypothetical protein
MENVWILLSVKPTTRQDKREIAITNAVSTDPTVPVKESM